MRLTHEQLKNMPESFKKKNPDLYPSLRTVIFDINTLPRGATVLTIPPTESIKAYLRKAKEVKKRSQTEKLKERFLDQWRLAKGPWPLASEFRFHLTRRWRFDYAFAPCKLAIEIQGGLFINGGHNRGAQQEQDFEKYNIAGCMGWTVFQLGTRMMTPEFIEPIAKFMNDRLTGAHL